VNRFFTLPECDEVESSLPRTGVSAFRSVADEVSDSCGDTPRWVLAAGQMK
jgi:hypothetical protein